MDYKNILLGVLFAISAILYYLAFKDQIKNREARGLFGIWNYGERFSSFLIIFILIIASIVYFCK